MRLYLYLYIYTKVWRATSGRRTPRRAADGRTPRRAADRRALCYGWACWHACAMGGRRIRREPRRGGREDVSTFVCLIFGHFVFAIFCSGFHLFWPFLLWLSKFCWLFPPLIGYKLILDFFLPAAVGSLLFFAGFLLASGR